MSYRVLKPKNCGSVQKTFLCFLFAIFASTFASTSLHAAPPSRNFPSAAEPGAIGQALGRQTLISNPVGAPSQAIQNYQAMTRQQLPASVQGISFCLKGFRIIHPIVYSCEELIAPYECLVGTTITLGKLQEIANEMTAKYQADGYLLTQVIIPEQHIQDGIATLQVISGYVGEVNLQGCVKGCVRVILEEYAQKMKNSYPFCMRDLERFTLLSNDMPGIKVQYVFTPSKTLVGAADVTLVASESLGRAYISVDNFGSRFLGPREFTLIGEIDSLFRGGDSTQLQVVTSYDEKMNFVQLRHEELIGCDGLRNGTYIRYLRDRPGSFLAPLDVIGLYDVVGTDFTYPIIRARRKNLFFQTAFWILEDKVDMLGANLYDDRTRPISAGISYNYLDSHQGINIFIFTLTQGLKILNASGNTNISRPGGKSDFTKINYTYSREQPFSPKLTYYFLITGQFAFTPLLASSQFSYGGNTLGRGYEPSELLGDNGVGGTLELRYNAILSVQSCIFTTAQYYVFLDMGDVWNIKANPPPQHASAASIGGGIRFPFTKHGQGNFYLAKPLTRPVSDLGNRHLRAFFSFALFTD